MPGAVQNASPVGVMPFGLCAGFEPSREYPLFINEYPDGSSERSLVGFNSRKRWKLKLNFGDLKIAGAPTSRNVALQQLYQFYLDHHGPLIPFVFYDIYETSPKFSYDASGVATTGRYVVHFVGEWKESSGMVFAESDLSLEELA